MTDSKPPIQQPGNAFRRERQPWMDEDDELLPVHPVIIASDQVGQAIAALERPASAFVRWPFSEVHAVTGQMAPGNVWFICAQSGGGKTTFVSSVIDLWRIAGKRIYVMPLETRAHEFRTYLACMATGIHPGDALSGHLSELPNYAAVRAKLVAEFHAQTSPPYVEQVMVSAQRAITLSGLRAGFKEAKAFGADVMIVDHIDHIEGGDGSNLYAEAKAVNHGALHLAQEMDMLTVFTSQLNQGSGKGDYLAKYLPPRPEQVAFGALKQQVATGMIGLFRPVRKRRPDEAEDEYVASLRAARAGTGNINDLFEPNTMGVNAMKLRYYGAREGMKTYLTVERGRVFTMDEKDKYTTGSGWVRRVI